MNRYTVKKRVVEIYEVEAHSDAEAVQEMYSRGAPHTINVINVSVTEILNESAESEVKECDHNYTKRYDPVNEQFYRCTKCNVIK